MNLPILPAHPDCRLCRMHEGANNVGIPTTWIANSLEPGPNVPAVVIIGQNPGREEDHENSPFIGPSGQFLRDVYINGLDLRKRASVYLTNALRCGPVSITLASLFNKCFNHTLRDLLTIGYFHHNAIRIILFVSAPAVRAFYRGVLKETVNQKQSFSMQGRIVHVVRPLLPSSPFYIPDHRPMTEEMTYAVYSTYHPAKVMRQNNFILPVKDHLALLSAHLDGTPLSPSTPTMTPTRSPR